MPCTRDTLGVGRDRRLDSRLYEDRVWKNWKQTYLKYQVWITQWRIWNGLDARNVPLE